MAFQMRTELPTFTPPIHDPNLRDVSKSLADAAATLLSFSLLAGRFTKASWDVEFEDDDSLAWLVLTAPRRLDEDEAIEQARELAGNLSESFYELDEF